MNSKHLPWTVYTTWAGSTFVAKVVEDTTHDSEFPGAPGNELVREVGCPPFRAVPPDYPKWLSWLQRWRGDTFESRKAKAIAKAEAFAQRENDKLAAVGQLAGA